jgi:two-component sensor histidine kinase
MVVPENDYHYLQGLTYILNDRDQDPIAPALADFLQSLDVRAEVVVPIVFTHSRQTASFLWGLLIVHQCQRPRCWENWEIQLLQQIAAALVIAIQQADLYAQVQAELADRQRAEAQLRNSLHEKEVLLKEVHHRVKNNMQLMSSLLSLQAQSIADPKILVEFQESQRRIAAMATMHEQLYRSDHLGKINMADYIQHLANSLLQSSIISPTAIHLNVEAVNVELGIDIAIPCGLMINELVSNSTKYAFPEDRSGHIAIRFLAPSPHQYQLVVQDDGVGMSPHINIANTSSLGLQIVKELTAQLDGTLTCIRQGGTAFVITFPVPETP